MDFTTSVKTCFSKYANFNGRAIRSEFWWFVLFCIVVGMVLGALDAMIFGYGAIGIFALIFQLGTIVPSLSVGARRLHDIGKSGWWQLLILIPIIGWIILIYWFAQNTHENENQFG
jgi:uncharacterized membrane protein YhaH (DUF805 family)